MVSDPLQVGGERRLFLDEVKQVMGGAAWEGSPFAGEIIPNGYAGGTTCTNPGLTFVVVCAGALGGFKFALDFQFKIVHG